MSYFRHTYRSFEEFQREALLHEPELGKEELELLQELELEDELMQGRRAPRMSRWD